MHRLTVGVGLPYGRNGAGGGGGGGGGAESCGVTRPIASVPAEIWRFRRLAEFESEELRDAIVGGGLVYATPDLPTTSDLCRVAPVAAPAATATANCAAEHSHVG